jgi:hypothetical protein
VTAGPPSRRRPGRGPAGAAAAALLAALVDAVLGGCAAASRPATTAPTGTAPSGTAWTGTTRAPAVPATPGSADALGRLVLTAVPSGLPRVPDDELTPPAGEKGLDQVAAYAPDPARERTVLRDYGFRWGWERFWGRDAAETSVVVMQFRTAPDARGFAADLATNEAGHYGAVLHEQPPGLPAGCRLLTVDHAAPEVGLAGPTAMVWCAHGVFDVAVTAVAGSVDDATGQVAAVVPAQLARLPG